MQTLCQCGETMASLATTTSGSVVFAGCGVGPTMSIMSTVSTIIPPMTTASPTPSPSPAPSPLPPPYHTGTCNVHIYEQSLDYTNPLYVELNITDGANDQIASQDYQINWGDSATVKAGDSHLPYDLTVDFTNRRSAKLRKRLGAPPPPVPWQDWIVTIAAGNTKWDDTVTDNTKLPYCVVGDWDNGTTPPVSQAPYHFPYGPKDFGSSM